MHGTNAESPPPKLEMTNAAALSTRVLQARFHPLADDREIIVVARVICAGDETRLEPATLTGLFAAPASVLLKLRYLVQRSAPDSFERLRALRSRFWSFVEIGPPDKESDA
jgi:hypothetical protein